MIRFLVFITPFLPSLVGCVPAMGLEKADLPPYDGYELDGSETAETVETIDHAGDELVDAEDITDEDTATDMVCPAGMTPCGDECVDLQGDPENCGACGRACPDGAMCRGGECECPPGLTECDGKCVDLMSDSENCGSCGHRCEDPLFCNGEGECDMSCTGGRTRCEGADGPYCADLSNDASNCGECGNVCPTPEHADPRCEDGSCTYECHENYWNLDGAPGCEYRCIYTGAEECNGKDDDCDGTADEGFECSPGVARTCTTACSTPGIQTCTSSCTWSECCAPDEVCGNGCDDDCDSLVDESGVLGPHVYVSESAADSAFFPSLAFTGSKYGVAWQDMRDGNNEIYFTLFDTDGTKLSADVRVTDAAGSSELPCLAFSGSEFAVTWEDRRTDDPGQYFARLSAAGAKIGGDIRITGSYSGTAVGRACLVHAGSEYGIFWDDSDYTEGDIYFARISETGTKLTGDIRVTSSTGREEYLSCTFTGSEYAVVWEDYRHGSACEVYFARIDSSGTMIGDEVRVTSAERDSFDPTVVFTGSGFALTWWDWRDSDAEIYFAGLSADGVKTGSDVRITSSSGESEFPSAVLGPGGELGIAWDDNRDGTSMVYFTRVSPDGTKLDVDLLVPQPPESSYWPAIAFDGGVYGMAWHNVDNGIAFSRVGCLTAP